jgi:two-component system LytT family response regulator
VKRKVLIVDDERLARDRLRDLLATFDMLMIVGECGTPESAIDAVVALRPEIVFLDVRMPRLDGFDVLAALEGKVAPEEMPVVIFVTAYDSYAMRAFEARALDYLQKPISRARLGKSVQRATEQLDFRASLYTSSSGVAKDSTSAAKTEDHATRFAVRRGDVSSFLKTHDIDWIDAAGNYVRLHAGGNKYLVRITLGRCEARLDPRQFIRVHRSVIVNLNRVAKVKPLTHGNYLIVTSDGTRLRSSRAYSWRVRELLRAGII